MSTTPPPDQPIAENDSALAKEMPRNEPSASSEANGPSRLRRRPSEEAKAQPSHTSSSPSLSTKNANKQVTWVTPPGKFGAVDKNEEAEAVRKKGMFRRVMAKLPDWLAESLVNKRKWKTFIRCMIAVLATMVLMLVQNSLNVLGQAAFFGLIMSQMLPPSLPLSIYIFAFLTLIVGMCTGWAWGCAAMASALRARSQILLAEQVQTAQSGYTENANLDAQYQNSIFHGAFLDPASSAVYGIFLFFGAYFFGFLRARKPRLMLCAIFGTIIMDLMCSFGPLFPIPEYTLATQLLTPAACFLAIALASSILIFPQSHHSVILEATIHASMRSCLAQLKLQDNILATPASDHERWTEVTGKAYKLRMEHVAGVNEVEGQVKFLELEISRGRMGPGDLAKVFEKAKELGARGYMLASFAMFTEERRQSEKKQSEAPGSHPAPRFDKHRELAEKNRIEHTTLDDLLPLMASATAPLRSAAQTSLETAIAWLIELNQTRWRKPKAVSSGTDVRERNLDSLRSAVQEFRQSKHFEILEPFRDAFDGQGNFKTELLGAYKYSGRDLFRCYVFTTNLVYFSLVLIEFLELLLEIERKTPQSKFQLPTRFAQMLVKSANDSTGGTNPLDMGVKDPGHVDGDEGSTETLVEEKDVEKGKTKKVKVYAKDPDANEPRNSIQRFGRHLSKLWGGLKSPSGIFALKYAIVSIALWVPAVCPSSAYFVYINRGLWALIMAQTGMGVYTGEQIGGFVVRMGGTCLGLVLGMLAWYIGAGSGSGNPYGVAAATMVIIAPCLYVRTVAPAAKMPFFLMAGVTIMFVVGYGWVDEHVYQTANQGSGAPLAGRRALLVIVGFTAAFIVMLFPRPTSAKLLVRRTLAKNIADIADLYGAVVTGVEDEVAVEMDKEWKMDVKGRQARYRARFLKIMARMLSLEGPMTFASLEPGLKGPWPKDKYHEILAIQGQMINALGVFSGAFARLEPGWCKALAERSGMMHPAFIADCFALFALLQQSLAGGTPLPPTMPIFERLAYHHHSWENGVSKFVALQAAKHAQVDGKGERVEGRSERAQEAEGRVMSDMGEMFNWDTVREEQFAVFATANVGLIHVISCLNDLYRVLVALVGEQELEGFDRAQARWARHEVGAEL